MPIIHTCDGDDVSPGMNIRTKKENLTSFALICDDPDAPVGDWVHWVIYNIPPGKDLPENIKKTIRPDLGYPLDLLQPIQGINDFGKIGYGGPCPPIGQEHRYFFKLYALDTVLKFNEADIQKGITKDMLLKAMDGHIFAEWYKIGKYKR
ncbi:MAG: YbhB/YbcL family Raf kinase inhibitor-like protein [candidate division Zixibacteria bacterium]|nr:YbhB/YbcL family Raf kinase inhibitor-like protein [candidate division Zixibacteria bacterium]